jgi:hypothetical protein
VSSVGLLDGAAAGRFDGWGRVGAPGAFAVSRATERPSTPSESPPERGEMVELSALLPGCPAAPPAGAFFMKMAGATAMAIISRMAQMVRRSMLSSQH